MICTTDILNLKQNLKRLSFLFSSMLFKNDEENTRLFVNMFYDSSSISEMLKDLRMETDLISIQSIDDKDDKIFFKIKFMGSGRYPGGYGEKALNDATYIICLKTEELLFLLTFNSEDIKEFEADHKKNIQRSHEE